MSKSFDEATKIADRCKQLGWEFAVRGSVFTIYKKIARDNKDDLVCADMEYYSILGLLKRSSSGSDWGTDCGGIGALSALSSGMFTMNRSGGNKNILKVLAKMS
jgi:hypothetical protein|tara:strand:- start:557 stop:868 length:312 start_codon:yes stop_codon:yes gene_type:complete